MAGSGSLVMSSSAFLIAAFTDALDSALTRRSRQSFPPLRKRPSAAAAAARTVVFESSRPLHSGLTALSCFEAPSASAACVRTRKSVLRERLSIIRSTSLSCASAEVTNRAKHTESHAHVSSERMGRQDNTAARRMGSKFGAEYGTTG